MSTLKVDAIRHNNATTDALVLSNNGSVAIGTCTAKLTSIGGGGLSHRNIVINGAMRVAQRGVTSTANGIRTVDRFAMQGSGADENPTQTQHTLTSSDTGPYEEGFRKSWHIQNGNQASGANSSDYVQPETRLEAQDLANCGWNYTSSSSFITLSFWVKSSVAGDYTCNFATHDGTGHRYLMEYTLAANTWKKITKIIPGNSNLTFNDDNGHGATIMWYPFLGSGFIQADQENNWYASSNGKYGTVSTSSWWTTNDATWEMTGVQLEVGDTATSFEHRSFGEELARCQRYFYRVSTTASGTGQYKHIGTMQYYGGSHPYGKMLDLPVPMRTIPTGSHIGDIRPWTAGGSPNGSFTSINYDRNDNKFLGSNGSTTNQNSGSNGDATPITLWTSSSMSADAEL